MNKTEREGMICMIALMAVIIIALSAALMGAQTDEQVLTPEQVKEQKLLEVEAAMLTFTASSLRVVQEDAVLPPILQEVVAAQVVSAKLWSGISLALCLISIALFFLAVSLVKENEEVGVILGIVGVVGTLLCAGFTVSDLYEWYYATHFPRLVILDYVKEFL